MGQNVRKNYGGRCGEKQCSGAKSEKRRDQSKHSEDRHSGGKSRVDKHHEDKTSVDECRDELMKEINDFLEHLEEQMNREFMQAGKTLAELYRAMCTAAAKLPNLELHTELMCVHNDEDGLTVIFHRDVAEGIASDPDDEGGDDDDDDEEGDGGDYEFGDYYDFNEEEEMLYDGD